MMASKPEFFYTRFPVLADVIIEVMEKSLESETKSIWSYIFQSANEISDFERTRAKNMIACVRVLKGGLR